MEAPGDSAGGGEHIPVRMVYRVAMNPILAALLWSTTALTDVQVPADATPESATQAPVAEATAAPEPPAGTATASDTAQILPVDPRLEAYEQFRALYETARFAEALPLAQRVVELSDTDQFRDIELPIAYNNLGATQFRLNDFQAAEASYRRSLDLLEASQGIASRRMIVPLAGLGAAYAALDQHALAAEQFDRALAVSRRADGLFNLVQLPLIEQAADSRARLGDNGGVVRELLYALKVLEKQYGFDDPRTLPALQRLAGFYESIADFVGARMMHLRIRDISMRESGGFNALAIRSLVAIARSHRMQYTADPESLDDLAERDPVTGLPVDQSNRAVRLVTAPNADRTGLKSATLALEVLRSVEDPPRQLLAETLTELGDWQMVTSRPKEAMSYYTEASTIRSADPESGWTNPLLAPRMIFHRAPTASKRAANAVKGEVLVRRAVFSLTVTETGETRDISAVTSDMSESQLAQARRALDRAIYSPRFEDGKPVATEGVQFTSEWYERRQPEEPSAAGS